MKQKHIITQIATERTLDKLKHTFMIKINKTKNPDKLGSNTEKLP